MDIKLFAHFVANKLEYSRLAILGFSFLTIRLIQSLQHGLVNLISSVFSSDITTIAAVVSLMVCGFILAMTMASYLVCEDIEEPPCMVTLNN